VPQLIDALAAQGARDIVVVVGGVIPASDYDFLKSKGVAAVFGPGSNIPRAASEILSLVRQRLAA
jgi:methylmalonyl-CoA mutase